MSCETLLHAGHTASGYYFVDGPGGMNYELVECNFDLDPADAEFQLATTTIRLPEYPVAFHCDVLSDIVGIFPCTGVPVNVGDALSFDGTFTVPLDGVYLFMFTGSTGTDDLHTLVEIRVDGVSVGALWVFDDFQPDFGNEILSGSAHAIVSVQSGQKVDSYLDSGTIGGRFTGHLLFTN